MYTLALTQNKNIHQLMVNSLCIAALATAAVSPAMFIAGEVFASEKTVLPAIESAVKARISDSVKENAFDVSAEKQLWESSIRSRYKNGSVYTVADGVKHIKITKYTNAGPIKLNVVEINRKLNPAIELSPALASDNLAKKDSVRNIAGRNNSLAAINGTYFKPENGVPLGLLMINKKLYTGPIYNRVALGISGTDFKMARVHLNATIRSRDGDIPIDNINQPRMLSTYVLLYTKDWGPVSPPTPKYGTQIAIKDNKIVNISDGSLEIPKDGYVISGPKEKLEPFFNAKKLTVDIQTDPDWADVDHIISGGPYLVKDENVYVDTAEQKLNSVTGRNPRTAVGYTKDKNLILVTVDGREESSIGMTLSELAVFMKGLGCVSAMNLDGGGSSAMYVKGEIVNNPSTKYPTQISNIFSVGINEQLTYKD